MERFPNSHEIATAMISGFGFAPFFKDTIRRWTTVHAAMCLRKKRVVSVIGRFKTSH
jgi:hypothetical protein